MAGNVKLKDIAETVGVSIVTVSNALSGKKGVSEEVRQRILNVAEEMGYEFQKKVAEGGKIGVVVSDKYLEVGASFYWSMYQEVVYAASKRNSFTLFEILDREITPDSKLPKLLLENFVNGLIVIGWMDAAYMERLYRAAKIPIVLLDFHDGRMERDAVLSMSYLGMYQMTRYLLERGHREIGFLGSVAATESIMDRYFGFRKGMEEWGVPIRPEWVLEDRDLKTGNVGFSLPDGLPTAFVCNCDYSAGFLYDKLRERGLRVPEDVSIVGYDDFLYGHPFAEEITTYRVDVKKMARLAVRILVKKMQGKAGHDGVRYVEGQVVERRSVRDILPVPFR